MIVAVVGAGINGVTAAIELRQRGHEVKLIDPGPLPHPLAASTDISKVVRAAYGADELYTALAERAIVRWREWNATLGQFYHDVGCLFVKQGALKSGEYEADCIELLTARGHQLVSINSEQLRRQFPAWNCDLDWHGFFDPDGGYAESSRVVASLVNRAVAAGVRLLEGSQFMQLQQIGNRISGIMLTSGQSIAADRVVFATGAWTPYLLPFTRQFFRATAQPVFHFQPREPELFAAARFPVFGADLSTTGYYGFPLNRDGVVKIGNHGIGREMSPDSAERRVTTDEIERARDFVARTFPLLVDAPIVYARICMYCDTADGDFWIAADPERPGVVVAAGDNGHGFKFAPVLGEIIADAVEEKPNPLLERFRWRPEVRAGSRKEAARPNASA